MKLITLNTWGGRSLHPLINFFKKRRDETDIFCLQEVFNADQRETDVRHPEQHVHADLFGKISEVLPDFHGRFASHEDDPHRMSLAMFIRKPIEINAPKDVVVFRPEKPQETGNAVISSRKLQYATVTEGKKVCTIVNFHGLWVNGPKTDTPARIAQAKEVRKFLDGITGPKILSGDFNLLPDTESLRILASGMRDLVKENDVQSTRTVLYRHYDNPDEPNFADYIFVSPEISVESFEVLPDLVSDHAPLCVEFT